MSDILPLVGRVFNVILPKLAPHFRPNALQEDYSRHVADTLRLGGDATSIALLEAETGTGKSFGYLVPLTIHCALTGERALVSTNTNHLSRQIIEEDGRLAVLAAREVTKRPVTLARRLGARNYVDMDRVRALREAVSGSAAARLDEWIDAKPMTFMEAAEAGLRLPAGVADADVCVTAGSSQEARQRYVHHLGESRDATILVTNHTLTLMHVRSGMKLLDAEGNPARIAVFDEADTLHAAAQRLIERKVPISTLSDIAASSDSEYHGEAVRAVDRLKKIVKPLVCEDVQRHVVIDDNDDGRKLREAVVEVVLQTKRIAKASGRAEAAEIMEVARDMEAWLKAAAEKATFDTAAVTASPVRRFPSLVTVNTNPARLLAFMWRQQDGGEGAPFRSVVMTSATIAEPGKESAEQPSMGFKSFTREVGISESDRVSAALFTPRDFGRMSFVLADRTAPLPGYRSDDDDVVTNPSWVAYVADGVRAAHARGGRTLVLTTSYADAVEIGSLVPGALVHSGGPLAPMLASYVAEPDAILLTPVAWTGVNLPGLIDRLVIPRIPFTPPSPIHDAALTRTMERIGRSEQHAVGIMRNAGSARMKRKLRQGIGRGIRQQSDKVELWVLDGRFPIPETWVKQFHLDQGSASRHRNLMNCIPPRFRQGKFPIVSAFERAEVFKWTGAQAESA